MHLASMAGNNVLVDLLCKKDKKLIIAKDKCDITPIDLADNEEIHHTLKTYGRKLRKAEGKRKDENFSNINPVPRAQKLK